MWRYVGQKQIRDLYIEKETKYNVQTTIISPRYNTTTMSTDTELQTESIVVSSITIYFVSKIKNDKREYVNIIDNK